MGFLCIITNDPDDHEQDGWQCRVCLVEVPGLRDALIASFGRAKNTHRDVALFASERPFPEGQRGNELTPYMWFDEIELIDGVEQVYPVNECACSGSGRNPYDDRLACDECDGDGVPKVVVSEPEAHGIADAEAWLTTPVVGIHLPRWWTTAPIEEGVKRHHYVTAGYGYGSALWREKEQLAKTYREAFCRRIRREQLRGAFA
jgi:hypothetical protein